MGNVRGRKDSPPDFSPDLALPVRANRARLISLSEFAKKIAQAVESAFNRHPFQRGMANDSYGKNRLPWEFLQAPPVASKK